MVTTWTTEPREAVDPSVIAEVLTTGDAGFGVGNKVFIPPRPVIIT